MATEAQLNFLTNSARQAKAAGHVFPAMAACEAALESSWFSSALYREAHNIFGEKAPHPPKTRTLDLPTNEVIHGRTVTVLAHWRIYSTDEDCYRDRMATLVELKGAWPHYAAALTAKTPEEYVTEVSQSWSTDPLRAQKCLEIYNAHKDTLAAAVA